MPSKRRLGAPSYARLTVFRVLIWGAVGLGITFSIVSILKLLFLVRLFPHDTEQSAVNNKRWRAFASRFDVPPFSLASSDKVLTRNETSNRVFISSIPVSVGEGLGHRFAMINFEIRLSQYFNLAYIHRRGRYGSLSPISDRYAVERLFGWAQGLETRGELMRKSCNDYVLVGDHCPRMRRHCVMCKELKSRENGGEFDRLVIVPWKLTECFLDRKSHALCHANVQKFLEKHWEPNTVFQMTPNRCFRDYLDGDFSKTRSFLRNKYWSFHSQRISNSQGLSTGHGLAHRFANWKRSRVLSLDPSNLQIAVHIRRGDFFNYTNRQIIPDTTYADVICEIKAAADAALGGTVKITANIYSEGVAIGRVKDNHDMSSMRPLYANEHGIIMKDSYWPSLIRQRMAHVDGTDEGLSVKLHIASDTIRAVHDMISADFFIGSQSGMSVQVVSNLARGIVYLPLKPDQSLGRGVSGSHLRFGYSTLDPTAYVNKEELSRRIISYESMYHLRLAKISER